MTARIIYSCAALVIALATPALAQESILHYRAAAVAGAEQAGIQVVALDPVSMGDVVTGAPYSAEAITEVTQTLTDGNRIERRTAATIARSSDGRIRREQSGFAVGALVTDTAQPIVTITDPKNGVHLTLNYDQKIAFRMKPGAPMISGATAEAGVAFGVGPFVSRTDSGAPGRRPTFSRAQRGMPPPPPPPGPFDGPAVGFESVAAAPMSGNAEFKSESLEPRTIEGLRAEGIRTTLTIPAGVVGNALPIEVVNERWYSPALQVVLMTHRSDPRFGETVYRLVNIVQSEPAAELFKVPSDFRIEELKP
jgi:hypothetical protein